MTRINLGVHPQELPDKLLLAEHREIKRIPNLIKSGKAQIVDIPTHFTLGKGHVKYFYDKMTSLGDRYLSILRECRVRKFKVEDYYGSFIGLPSESYRLISRAEIARARPIVVERIREKGFKLKPCMLRSMEIKYVLLMKQDPRLSDLECDFSETSTMSIKLEFKNAKVYSKSPMFLNFGS